MIGAPSVGIYLAVIFTERDLVSGIYADEYRPIGWLPRVWRDRGAFGDVGKDGTHVGRIGDVFEKRRVGVAGGGGVEVGDGGLEGTN